jgi:hypothetical protein
MFKYMEHSLRMLILRASMLHNIKPKPVITKFIQLKRIFRIVRVLSLTRQIDSGLPDGGCC